MKTFWRGLLFAVFVSLGGFAQAREHAPLDQLVARSELIVKCQIEVKNDAVYYRVAETWKGEYFPDAFVNRPADGYLYPVTGNRFKVSSSLIVAPVAGREVIFFFTRNDPRYARDGKLLKHSDWLVVVDGKVNYPVSQLNGREVERMVYSLEDFKHAVIAATDQ